ncbi:MAG: ribosome-associated translation inhibitor RaiA [Erysipelotrichaceae bacterium]|nr:ribosome-associated translation inhibitor RaiA [Erysipelotrichaceae bacterium]MBQ9986812.1 ribosome-associated translation inhibitor RaiA [Erysipelotrichales bacterium]
MKVNIYGKNVQVTPAMQEKIEKKLSFLNKYFVIDEETVANVVVAVLPLKHKIEVTIPTRYGLLRAEVAHEDMYSAIDLVVDKLEDQVRRQKTRLSRRSKDGLAQAFLEDDYFEEEEILVKTKTIAPEAMELDEAVMRMEMLGHTFFIYREIGSDNVCVVYKRHDGGYGLIETE